MRKCKTCGANCEKEYCFKHKPRKPLPIIKKKMHVIDDKGKIYKIEPLIDDFPPVFITKEEERQKMYEFFLSIWNKRKHLSEVSGDHLGNEPYSIFFHHILPKNKYPEAAFDEQNIILLTWTEHDQVEANMYYYEEINKRREQLKIKYNVA